MSVERYFHWRCDVCGWQVAKRGYGLPRGWVVAPVGTEGNTHFCEEHVALKDLPREKWPELKHTFWKMTEMKYE